MCLAIPAKVTELKEGGLATVDIMGVTREISVDLTPQVELGSYVLVHAGFAIEVVSEELAEETLDLIRQFPELVAEDLAGDAGLGGQSVGSPLAGLAALMDEDLSADPAATASASTDATFGTSASTVAAAGVPVPAASSGADDSAIAPAADSTSH